jgi:hypothetical protein
MIAEFSPAAIWRKIRTREIRVTALLAVALGLAVGGHLCMTTVGSVYRMLKRNGEVRAALAGKETTEWRGALRRVGTRTVAMDPALSAKRRAVECLQQLGEKPLVWRATTALYIPKTNREYWDMRQIGTGTTPFIAPAIAQTTMVLGLPEYEDIGWAANGWGYPQYALPTGPEPPAEKLGEAADKARRYGFLRLIVFRGVSAAGCDIEEKKLK